MTKNDYYFSPSHKRETYQEARTGFELNAFQKIRLHTHVLKLTFQGKEFNAFLPAGQPLDESWPEDIVYVGCGTDDEVQQDRILIKNELEGLAPELYGFSSANL